MKYYYVYILRCADNMLFTEMCTDLEQDLMYHQKGLNRNAFTYCRRPVRLELFQRFTNEIQASAYKRKLKGWSRAKKEALVNRNFEHIQTLAECRNATHYKYKP